MREIADRLYGGNANFLRLRRYGVTQDAYEAMILAQDGNCALCRKGGARHLDHDHESKKVRAILCFSCNRGLGKFNDDPALLRKAVAYLKKVA
jgi:hypothetical protein